MVVERLMVPGEPGELNPSGSNEGGSTGGETTIMSGRGEAWASGWPGGGVRWLRVGRNN